MEREGSIHRPQVDKWSISENVEEPISAADLEKYRIGDLMGMPMYGGNASMEVYYGSDTVEIEKIYFPVRVLIGSRIMEQQYATADSTSINAIFWFGNSRLLNSTYGISVDEIDSPVPSETSKAYHLILKRLAKYPEVPLISIQAHGGYIKDNHYIETTSHHTEPLKKVIDAIAQDLFSSDTFANRKKLTILLASCNNSEILIEDQAATIIYRKGLLNKTPGPIAISTPTANKKISSFLQAYSIGKFPPLLSP